MLREIDESSSALDEAVDAAVADLKEDNMERVSNSVLVFVTYTIGSLFLVVSQLFDLFDIVSYRSPPPHSPPPPVSWPWLWTLPGLPSPSLDISTRSTRILRCNPPLTLIFTIRSI